MPLLSRLDDGLEFFFAYSDAVWAGRRKTRKSISAMVIKTKS